ncbi:hypothetical protein U3516DRAFT_887859 [Neocallimastix sp. 'constans']
MTSIVTNPITMTTTTPKRRQEDKPENDYPHFFNDTESLDSYQPPNKRINQNYIIDHNNELTYQQHQPHEKLLPSPSSSRSSQEYVSYNNEDSIVINLHNKVKNSDDDVLNDFDSSKYLLALKNSNKGFEPSLDSTTLYD